jgi:hypothetical protein
MKKKPKYEINNTWTWNLDITKHAYTTEDLERMRKFAHECVDQSFDIALADPDHGSNYRNVLKWTTPSNKEQVEKVNSQPPNIRRGV